MICVLGAAHPELHGQVSVASYRKIFQLFYVLNGQTTQLRSGKGPEQTLLQGGHTEGPETYERILSITSHQRDAN